MKNVIFRITTKKGYVTNVEVAKIGYFNFSQKGGVFKYMTLSGEWEYIQDVSFIESLTVEN